MNGFSHLINIIYPPRCHICGRFLPTDKYHHLSHYICDDCRASLIPVTNPICIICSLPFATSKGQDHLCENCMRNTPWYDFARAPYLYSGLIMESIQRFKYRSETYLASYLGALLSSFAGEWIKNPKDFIVMPVPIHRRRLRERKFNQSLVLARILTSDLGTKLNYLSLIRNRDTKAQTGLNREERRKNVKNAFSITDKQVTEGKEILLVDDVFTTGHTLNECAKTLKKSGARRVICLTLARTLFD